MNRETSMRSELPSVQVLLATYNGARFLDEQMESILGQRGVTTSVLCRDDQSSDQTLQRLATIKERHGERVEFISDDIRMGAATPSFLTLLQQTHLEKFDYVAFSDQDDIWLPEKLAKAVRTLVIEDADGYASNLVAFDEITGRKWLLKKSYPQIALDYAFQSASAGCTYVLSRRAAKLVVEQITGRDMPSFKSKSHDWLIYAICRSHKLRWIIDSSAQIRYRQHGQNQYGAQRGFVGLVAKLKLMRSGWYRNEIIENAEFLSKNDFEAQRAISRLQTFTWTDRLWLAANSFKFRRRRLEAIGLSILFIIGAI